MSGAPALEDELAPLDDEIAEPIQSQDETADQTPSPDPVEALAKELGWKPEADWKGPKDGWTAADEYLRTTFKKQREAAERVKQLSQTARHAMREKDELALRLERLERSTGQIMQENEARVRAEVRAQYEAAKKQAAKDGDDARYDELDAEQDKVLKEISQRFKKDPEPDVTQIARDMLADPVVGAFWRDNAWVAEDEDAYNYVYAVADKAARAGKSEPEQIMIVEEMLRRRYPDRYEAGARRGRPAPDPQAVEAEGEDEGEAPPRDPDTGQFVPRRDAAFYQQPARRAPPAVQSGTRTAAGLRGTPEQKAAASLPPEALRTFQEMKKAGRFKGDIVKYAKIYNGEVDNVLD